MDEKQWADRHAYLRERALSEIARQRYPVEVDAETGSAYVQIRRGNVKRTISVLPNVNLDLDWLDRVVGIEVI